MIRASKPIVIEPVAPLELPNPVTDNEALIQRKLNELSRRQTIIGNGLMGLIALVKDVALALGI